MCVSLVGCVSQQVSVSVCVTLVGCVSQQVSVSGCVSLGGCVSQQVSVSGCVIMWMCQWSGFGQCVSPSVRVSVMFRSVGVSLSGCVSEQCVGPSGCGGQYACRYVRKSNLKTTPICVFVRERDFRERVWERERLRHSFSLFRGVLQHG